MSNSYLKPLDVCCMTKNLLAFYLDKVFKDHQETNPQILRKISSIANSFFYMQKVLQQCVSPHIGTPSICSLSAPRESQDMLAPVAL